MSALRVDVANPPSVWTSRPVPAFIDRDKGSVMDVVRLPVGQQAPVDSDCIRIEQTAVKTFELTGSALCSDDGTEDSVSIVGGPVFDSGAKAEASGLAWAVNAGVTRLIIINATLDQPFELLEIDKTL